MTQQNSVPTACKVPGRARPRPVGTAVQSRAQHCDRQGHSQDGLSEMSTEQQQEEREPLSEDKVDPWGARGSGC